MLNESDSHFNKHPAQTPGETWVLERAWIQKHAKIITGVLVTSEQLPPPNTPESRTEQQQTPSNHRDGEKWEAPAAPRGKLATRAPARLRDNLPFLLVFLCCTILYSNE